MKILKLIFKLMIALILTSVVISSAQANCPNISNIIKDFNKSSMLPKGWLLVSYTGKQIDNGFQFTQVSWDAVSTYNKNAEGNIVCEYESKNKINPGFLIIQTTFTRPAPQGKNWQHLPTATKSTICKSRMDNPADCNF